MNALLAGFVVAVLTLTLLVVVYWMQWYWKMRRRRIARLAKRSIDKAERRLRTPARSL